MSGGIPPSEATGRYLRLYYTQQEEDCILMKPAGAEKAVSLTDFVNYSLVTNSAVVRMYLLLRLFAMSHI